ncbi:hypothetical protein FOZ62_000453, partial [Perkinsus olseni]
MSRCAQGKLNHHSFASRKPDYFSRSLRSSSEEPPPEQIWQSQSKSEQAGYAASAWWPILYGPGHTAVGLNEDDFIAKRNADDPESMQFWPTWLSEVQLVINCTPFSNSELSPAELMYAYKVSKP